MADGKKGGSGGASSDTGIEMEDSNMAKLRRLASNPDYHKGKEEHEEEMSSPTPNRASLALTSLISPSTRHADIRNFVEKEYVKSSASKELIRHLFFIVIFITGVTLHRSVYQSFLANQALVTAFVTQQTDSELQPFPKTFLDVGQFDEFRDWLLSVVGGTLDADQFYSGRNMTSDQRDYVMFNNRLLGGVRLRQLRAAPNKNCKTPYQLRNMKKDCYNYLYSEANHDSEPFGPPENPTKYNYVTQEDTGSVSIFGYILDYLEGGGYTVDVNLESRDNGTSITDSLKELMTDGWMDASTRAVIITMNFLNMELESRVSVLYLILEIPGNGMIFPTFMIKTFRLNLYVVPLDYFRLFLEIVFVIFVVYAIYSESYEMVTNYKNAGKKGLKRYFVNGWNIIEWIDIVLYVVVISMYAKYLVSPERYKVNLDSRKYFPEMEQLAATALIFYNVCAINVILTTFRTFKYLRLNHRLYLLWKTLKHAGADLVGFLFIFLIFIFGFIFMGWLSFGADLADFSTFVRSFASSWNFIIGNAPDYGAMYLSNRILGPLFFVLFTIFIFFILTNMFIAILSNSFEVVCDSNEDTGKLKDILEEKLFEMITGIRTMYNQALNKEKKKRSILQILDGLENPGIIEQDHLTRDDVARAIGSSGTQAEVDDLYNWIKKLEAKRQKKALRVTKLNVLDEPDTARTPTPDTPISLTRKQGAEMRGIGGEEDAHETLRVLQAQMKEIKTMLARMSDDNNNNKKGQ